MAAKIWLKLLAIYRQINAFESIHLVQKILARKKSFSLFDINSQPKNQQIIAHNWLTKKA